MRAGRAVLGVGFEDLVVRVEGMLERTELVGLQAWMPGVLRQERDARVDLFEEALVPTRLATALARPPLDGSLGFVFEAVVFGGRLAGLLRRQA